MADLSTLNKQQLDAVYQSTDKNIVLLAGAGSGKTATLVKRTEYLVDDLKVDPASIMVITFTNKAAKELKERVTKVSNESDKMWIGTFHSICVRLLRKFGYVMGINNFSIIDQNESKKIIKNILETKNINITKMQINVIQSKISSYKNDLIRPAQVAMEGKEDKLICDVYQEYQNICWANKTFDFDDLIIYAILLLSSYKDVLDWVHSSIKYIAVDECQDTNSSQFTFIKLIAGMNNVMLCGDVNQSIYGFRNAKPQYLENFAKNHPNTVVLKLEQNYRSTKRIINAANEVIKNNDFGTKLTMFTDNPNGETIKLLSYPNSVNEAKNIAEIIKKSGRKPSDFAVIYRTNYQSRALEDEFMKADVPYVIFGSQSFYSRKEVKDLIAFCKLVINPSDLSAFSRILDTVRGIGKVSIAKIVSVAVNNDYRTAIANAVNSGLVPTKTIFDLNAISVILNKRYNKCSDIVNDVLYNTGYLREIRSVDSREATEKLDIINEFLEMLKTAESKNDFSMQETIDKVSLLSEVKGEEKESLDAVKFMTAHASKGLEFPVVFIIGAQDGVFPHINAIQTGNKEDIEEERRLFYVAMTRAKEELLITRSETKFTNKAFEPSSPSRFIKEIPKKYVEEVF